MLLQHAGGTSCLYSMWHIRGKKPAPDITQDHGTQKLLSAMASTWHAGMPSFFAAWHMHICGVHTAAHLRHEQDPVPELPRLLARFELKDFKQGLVVPILHRTKAHAKASSTSQIADSWSAACAKLLLMLQIRSKRLTRTRELTAGRICKLNRLGVVRRLLWRKTLPQSAQPMLVCAA